MHSIRINYIRKKTSRGLLRLLPVLFAITLLINGCTVKHPVQRPSQSKPPTTSKPTPTPTPTYPKPPKHPSQPTYPSQPPPSTQPVEPAEEPAVVYTPKLGPAATLYASAQEAIDRGNYQQAEMSLERAIRIEPRNGHYWYTMAQVKYKQKQYSQAVNLCSKSKSLAGKNAQLIYINDELIFKARQQLSQ